MPRKAASAADGEPAAKRRQQTPVQLLAQIVMMTRSFTKAKMEKKTEVEFKKLLGEQLDNVIGLAEELYGGFTDDFREDSVHDVLSRVCGFVPKTGEVAASWKPQDFDDWQTSHESLEELRIILSEAATPAKKPPESPRKGGAPVRPPTVGDATGKGADKAPSADKHAAPVHIDVDLTPGDLGKDPRLLAWAKSIFEGQQKVQAPGGASGETSKNTLSVFDFPTMKSISSGLYFEESASGVPELKKTPKMSFERWNEWSNNCCDRMDSVEERQDYRMYTTHLVTFKEQKVPWDTIMTADAETREMIKNGELSGFGDPRVLSRLLTKFRTVESDAGPRGPRLPKGPKGGKVDWVKLGLCKFWNLKGRCAKGNDCDFKHEKPK